MPVLGHIVWAPGIDLTNQCSSQPTERLSLPWEPSYGASAYIGDIVLVLFRRLGIFREWTFPCKLSRSQRFLFVVHGMTAILQTYMKSSFELLWRLRHLYFSRKSLCHPRHTSKARARRVDVKSHSTHHRGQTGELSTEAACTY